LGYLFGLVALAGFFDATYLAIKHFEGLAPNCSILNGCEVVTTSSYSVIFGVPVALMGSVYYLTVLLLTVAYLDSPKRWKLDSAAVVVCFGLLATVWFVYLQLFVIHALCLYCMFSALTTTTLFLFIFFWWRHYRLLITV